jgi:hypothetical protein
LKRYKTLNDLPLTATISMYSLNEINKSKNINEARVVKLKKLSNNDDNGDESFSRTKTSTPITTRQNSKCVNDSLTTVSSLDDNNNNNNKVDGSISKIHSDSYYGLAKLYIVRDFHGSLIYGDLNVRQGEIVYLLCKSERYLFVENQFGKFGFIPVDVCVDLDEVIVNAKCKLNSFQAKVTSF